MLEIQSILAGPRLVICYSGNNIISKSKAKNESMNLSPSATILVRFRLVWQPAASVRKVVVMAVPFMGQVVNGNHEQ